MGMVSRGGAASGLFRWRNYLHIHHQDIFLSAVVGAAVLACNEDHPLTDSVETFLLLVNLQRFVAFRAYRLTRCI